MSELVSVPKILIFVEGSVFVFFEDDDKPVFKRVVRTVGFVGLDVDKTLVVAAAVIVVVVVVVVAAAVVVVVVVVVVVAFVVVNIDVVVIAVRTQSGLTFSRP